MIGPSANSFQWLGVELRSGKIMKTHGEKYLLVPHLQEFGSGIDW